jgi:hypothetical protein
MKMKMMLAAMLLFFSFSAVQAQPPRRTVEERVKMVIDTISAKMTLKETQVKSCESIFTEYFKEMDKLREGMEPGTRPDRSAMEKLIGDRDGQLKKVLSEEQFNQFKNDIEPAMRPRRMRRGGNEGPQ